MRIRGGGIRRAGRWSAVLAVAVPLAVGSWLCLETCDREFGSRILEFVQTGGEWLVERVWVSSHLGGGREVSGWDNDFGNDWQERKGEPGGQWFLEQKKEREPDPSYRRYRQEREFYEEHPYLAMYGNEESGSQSLAEAGLMEIPANDGLKGGNHAVDEREKNAGEDTNEKTEGKTGEKTERKTGEKTGGKTGGKTGEEEMSRGQADEPTGTTYVLEQLMDYDFLMKHFYNVHTSTTADRKLMDAKALLSHDLTLEKQGEGPQILIYHTHSQEAYCDSGPGETVVEVGSYLADLLEQKGYQVYHDTSVYDLRDGKLDRNKAYNYALEGIQAILKENPSIEVVLDLHRDGVGDEVRLVSEIDGKPTAKIMFFNGLSQTPEGPIEYLKNPYREDNLAFSLALQLKAAAFYPGFTRKIYLKGLRYNQHLCPRSSLVEAGAQTNTYAEAKNAMEPLAELLDMVLRPQPL